MTKKFCKLLFFVSLLILLSACLEMGTQNTTSEDFHRIDYEARIFLNDGLSKEQHEILKSEIFAISYVADVRLVTPDEALADLGALFGSDLFNDFQGADNPLAYAFYVRLENIPCVNLGVVANQLEALFGVMHVDVSLICLYCLAGSFEDTNEN
ncbi:MAG: permease-like cell division protein FtsX [Defluviitaleaceae bacterium]|nr:permease-like cell division protein FtsX [Defluviitaleaceae bacterium]